MCSHQSHLNTELSNNTRFNSRKGGKIVNILATGGQDCDVEFEICNSQSLSRPSQKKALKRSEMPFSYHYSRVSYFYQYANACKGNVELVTSMDQIVKALLTVIQIVAMLV